MANTHQDKQESSTTTLGLAAAALTGAVVGTGVAIVGALALKDKKNRERVKSVFNEVKNQAVEYMDQLQQGVKNEKEHVKKSVQKVADTTKSAKKVKRSISSKKHLTKQT
jgi:hypothetical protein